MAATHSVMVFAEQNGGRVHPVAYELLGKGRDIADRLGTELSAVLVGNDLAAAAQELIYGGADAVYVFDNPALDSFDIMNYRRSIVDLAKEVQPDVILLGATAIGRSLGPRLAAALGTGLTADCTALEVDGEGHLVQIRPAFSGNILAHIKTDTRPQMATVRYKIMQALPRDCSRTGRVTSRAVALEEPLAVMARVAAGDATGTSVAEAEVVVCGGRGLKKPEDLKLLQQLADAVGGVLACSKPLVDAGWLEKDQLVGFSGNTVRPRIYFAVGVSGSSQHLIGMRNSDTIVAINTDPSADIFQVADYGIVGDLYDIVPRLTAAVQTSRSRGDREQAACN
ncbi:MAG: electron transfer flavoprotein subunit alpha/FixB family protein [Dehalococcoidia bacterium]|nr:electron transfer flavoprotein subunit alpha/FixB family protein [Dehalococcoidia bacterium]